jgi:hypothetical protein
MGRGKRIDPRHRGSNGKERHSTRGSRDEPWDLLKNSEDDPFRELKEQDPYETNPADDEYIWPVLEEENDDLV